MNDADAILHAAEDVDLDEVRRTCDGYRLAGLDELIEESGISILR